MIKSTINENKAMKSLLKEMFLYFHLVLLVILLANTISFYIEGSHFYFRLFLMCLIYDFFVTAVIIKMPYDTLKPFVIPYLIAVYLFMWYFVLCIWRSNPAVLAILIVFPFGINTIFSKKIVLYWCFSVVLTIIITLLLPNNFFSVTHRIQNHNYENIKLLSSLLLILAYIFYYNSKVINMNNLNNDKIYDKDLQTDEKNKEIYDDLYNQILNYFESESPWKDPDFGILDLAAKLNTNNTYISRAVNKGSGMNFKTFLNKYRIDYIKSKLFFYQIV